MLCYNHNVFYSFQYDLRDSKWFFHAHLFHVLLYIFWTGLVTSQPSCCNHKTCDKTLLAQMDNTLIFLEIEQKKSHLINLMYQTLHCRHIFAQSHYREVPRWEIFMEQELRFGLDLGRMADISAYIASKSINLWNHDIPQKCLYNLWHILMYQKYIKL